MYLCDNRYYSLFNQNMLYVNLISIRYGIYIQKNKLIYTDIYKPKHVWTFCNFYGCVVNFQ